MSEPSQQGPWQLRWHPSEEPQPAPADEKIRLQSLAENRIASAAQVVREGCEALLPWVYQQAADWTWVAARRDLARILERVARMHGWRGTVATWLANLDQLCRLRTMDAGGVSARAGLAEELGLWLGGADEMRPDKPGWDGVPGSPGCRIPDRAACAKGPAAQLEHGEVIGVHGDSETVELALLEAQAMGLAPTAFVSQGGPELGGRRLATRLAEAGVRVHFFYDCGLLERLSHVDRMWLGTEAVGAESFVAVVGTRALLESAERLEIPRTLLATSDSWMPEGELKLPEWGTADTWLLWERAPMGVEVECQPLETVSLSLMNQISDEHGLGRPSDLALRALKTRPPVAVIPFQPFDPTTRRAELTHSRSQHQDLHI